MSTIGIQAPRIHTPSTRLRMTARGRRVLLALAALPLAVGIAFSVIGAGSALASNDLSTVEFSTVTVMPGDTLWSIATATAPDADPRIVIDDIARLNGLTSGMIQVGTSLAIPVQYSR